MNCKCGHSINLHNHNGCQHVDRPNEMDLVCRCWVTPEVIAESKLSALREAGEKMAERLRDINKISGGGLASYLYNESAIEEWEAANK